MVEDRVEKAYCFGIVMVEKFFDLVLENARRTGLLHPGRGDIRRRLFASSEVRQLSVSEDEDEEVEEEEEASNDFSSVCPTIYKSNSRNEPERNYPRPWPAIEHT